MKTKIIYIIGAGRSGTTLLDIILGNATDIFSAGELNRFAKRFGIPHDARDEKVAQFWKQIKEDLTNDNIADFDEYNNISKKIEYHTSLFKAGSSKKRRHIFNIYAAYQKKLFSNIAKHVLHYYKKTIILDSSKYPVRGFMLAKIFGSDISFIYLKRNPIAVVESFQKKDVEQPPKNRFKANIYLLAVNMISNRVITAIKKKNKVAVITYDDLIKDPILTLSHIETNLDINLHATKQLIKESKPLQVGLLFDGNRLRLQNEIIFNKKVAVDKSKKLSIQFFTRYIS